MIYLNPAILTALAVAVAPIIIHFLYLKRKNYVEFSSLHFIKQIEKQKRIKTSWLEYILLLLRILTIVAVVLAFAQPISELNLPLSNKQKEHHFISVQNDRYTQIKNNEGSLKRDISKAVQAFLENTREEDLIYFVNPNSGDISSITKNNVLAKLTELKATRFEGQSLAAIESSIKDYAEQNSILHFKAHHFRLTKALAEPEFANIYYSAENTEIKNNAVSSVQIQQAALVAKEALSLDIRFKDYLQENAEILVVVNGKTVFQDAIKDSSLQAIVSIGSFAKGIHQGYVRILADDNYLADNSRYFNFEIAQERKVLVLSESSNSVLNSLFTALPDSSITISIDQNSNALRYSLNNYSSVFFEGNLPNKSIAKQLQRYLQSKNGHLILVPSKEQNLASWNKSVLAKYLRFGKVLGSKDTAAIAKLRIPSYKINTAALPNFFQFATKKAKAIDLSYAYQIRNMPALIGDRRLSLLNYSEEDQLFAFASPLAKEATDFIYDARFVPLIYGLIFATRSAAFVSDTSNTLQINSQNLPNKLSLIGSKNYQVNIQKKARFSASYTLPNFIENGNYKVNLANESIAASVNDPSILASNLEEAAIALSANSAYESGQFQHWRLALLFALLFYTLELYLGRGRT